MGLVGVGPRVARRVREQVKPSTCVRVARLVAMMVVWEIAGRVRERAEVLCEAFRGGVDPAVRAVLFRVE